VHARLLGKPVTKTSFSISNSQGCIPFLTNLCIITIISDSSRYSLCRSIKVVWLEVLGAHSYRR